jgi:hypothetical protein
MNKLSYKLALCASLLVASPALAQTSAPAATGPAKPAAAAPQKPQIINIEDGSDVDGQRVSPNVDLVTGRGTLRPSSLISIRTNFQAEMLKSVESL